ncbi:ABC transporter substrate-binding protein [Halanaerobium praevalens]|uniref:Extracellular solute-binding protein family 5 n=1 Tax=Halanaerobium praevalens (strain ATCC 33744 / DSM 2228 / GSL) TaxID=572479 RepID=E3DNN9_HALPG|nr:ABC transporter substrate-binding protein [Halanaerobium praevalens]ADO77589.1 extracellular solute-binding protein family 5 [Halanaerobium praevalens DSM 2228]
MNFKKIFFLTFLVIILLVPNLKAADSTNNLKIKIKQRPFTLNPIYGSTESELMIINHLFENLVKYDQEGKIVPFLAKSWEVNNSASVFDFILKEDIYFQAYEKKGIEVPQPERKVKAQAWKNYFEYLAAPKNKSPYADLLKRVKGYKNYREGTDNNISGIKVIDEYQLRIELKESYYPFIYNLAKKPMAIIAVQAASENKFDLKPIGTGRFRVKNFLKDRLLLEKNKEHWQKNNLNKKLNSVNQIEFNFANLDFKNDYNKFDLYQLNTKELKYYQDHKNYFNNYQLKQKKKDFYYFLALVADEQNNRTELKKLKRFFKQNKFKLDNNSIINSFQSENELLNNSNFKNNPIDLIDNHIQKNTLALLNINNSEQSRAIALFLKQNFEKKEIDFIFKKYDWLEYLKSLKNNNFENQLILMSYTYQNQFEFIFDNFYSTSSNNYFNYKNKRLNNLINYLKITSDSAKQQQAYQIIAEILAKDSPILKSFRAVDNYLFADELAEKYLLNY